MIYEPHEPTPTPAPPSAPVLHWHLVDLIVIAGLGLALVHTLAAALDLLLAL